MAALDGKVAIVTGGAQGIGREGSSYGIDEWLELKYWAVGGVEGGA